MAESNTAPATVPTEEPNAPAVAEAEAIQPLDEAGDHSETDSSYGAEHGSATTSITSSIYHFNEENGRTYHSYEAGKYLMPNDEPEMDRMDIHYHAIRVLFGDKAFLSPIDPNPQCILDQATGTGIWVMDVGDMYPGARVIGTDLSPIQPTWVPPNVEFRVDDIEKPWLFSDNTFDLVHSRLTSGMAIRSWDKYLAEAFRVTKPGGWTESQEFDMRALSDDNTLPPKGAIVDWHILFCEAAIKAGFNMNVTGEEIEQKYRDAGFVNVHRVPFKMPIGPWPKDPRLREAGSLTWLGMMEGIDGLSIALFCRVLGWSRERLEVFLAEVRNEWKQKKIHCYWNMHIVYGQKPVSAT